MEKIRNKVNRLFEEKSKIQYKKIYELLLETRGDKKGIVLITILEFIKEKPTVLMECEKYSVLEVLGFEGDVRSLLDLLSNDSKFEEVVNKIKKICSETKNPLTKKLLIFVKGSK